MLAGKVLCLKSGANFFTGVARIPLVHDVPEGCEFIIPLQCVHIIVQSDQTGVVLAEDFHIRADLQVIPSESGHVLDDASLDVPCLHLVNHRLKARTVKACP